MQNVPVENGSRDTYSHRVKPNPTPNPVSVFWGSDPTKNRSDQTRHLRTLTLYKVRAKYNKIIQNKLPTHDVSLIVSDELHYNSWTRLNTRPPHPAATSYETLHCIVSLLEPHHLPTIIILDPHHIKH